MQRQSGELGHFGDARRAAMGSTLIERVMETGSLVIRRLGRDRAGEMAIHRFLSAASVSTGEMVPTLATPTIAACAGRPIVALQDTTEINFAGREDRRRGLGPAGDGISAGFFLHPLIAVDSGTDAVLGLLDAQIWTRSDEVTATPAGARAIEDKESIRWLRGAEQAAAHLTDAASVVVADREGDIYAGFARLFAAATAWPELARTEVAAAPSRTGARSRIATVALRAGSVVIARPRDGGDRRDPAQLTLTLVEAREIDGPTDGQPLLWRLLTTRTVTNAADAQEVVRLYRLRWRIEEGVPRPEKRRHAARGNPDARRRPAVQAGAGRPRRRHPHAATGRCPRWRPATDVINAALLPAADAIGPTLQGKTARQQNPHPRHSLAWIIARLGGWNCYDKPPGPKTMRTGWAQFATMATGFLIAITQINV